MSLFFRTLRSGSSGNGLVMYTREGALLIDLGLPAKTALAECLSELRQRGITVLGALITHSHGDHFSPGPLRVMAGQGIPVWACGGAIDHACRQKDLGYWSGRPEFRCYDGCAGDRRWEIGPFEISAIEVTHAPDVTCHAFSIVANCRSGRTKAVVATDLCHPGELPAELPNADLIYLECNYDPELLRLRPNYSSRFHLENGKCGKLLAAARKSSNWAPQQVFLGHLSTQRNSPSIAMAAVRGAFQCKGVALDFPVTPAPRHHPSVTVEVSAAARKGEMLLFETVGV